MMEEGLVVRWGEAKPRLAFLGSLGPRVPGSGDTFAPFSNIISSASSNHVV